MLDNIQWLLTMMWEENNSSNGFANYDIFRMSKFKPFESYSLASIS